LDRLLELVLDSYYDRLLKLAAQLAGNQSYVILRRGESFGGGCRSLMASCPLRLLLNAKR
jgi:hypothetical protein